MAESGGHWKDLAEAQKLTQSMKVPGVIEEDIKRVNPLDRLPVAQAAHSGRRIEWLRENTLTEGSVTEVDIGELLAWSEDVEYTEVNEELKRIYIQRKMDHFVEGIYGTYNNYEAQKLLECEKGLKRKIGARIIYGDTTYGGSKQMDGLHALAGDHGSAYDSSNTGNDAKNINGAEAGLSLSYLRILLDEMKHGCDELWAPYEIVRRLDAAYQERGFAGSQYDHSLAFMAMGYNEAGKRILFFDGVPIVRTDYLVAEEGASGTDGTSIRELHTNDPKNYSIFGVTFGNVMAQEPGITYAYGGTEGAGDLYKLVRFPELEDYDAGGIRLVNYSAMLLGSTLCLGRIFDITDVATIV